MRRGWFQKVGAVVLCCILAMPAVAAETPVEQEDSAVHQAEGESDGVQNTECARLLDEEELASLTARAEEPADDVAGGALTNQQLTYIVIALAAAVIVLIAK
jgi:hypothetical protein